MSRSGAARPLLSSLLAVLLAAAFPTGPAAVASPAELQVVPATGPLAGGTRVRIIGHDLDPGTAVRFGDVAALKVVYLTSRRLSATPPPHAAGAVDVTVTRPDGRTTTLRRGFAYVAPAFTEMAEAAGVAFAHRRGYDLMPFGGGVAVADFDGDGLLDLYVTSVVGANALYRNLGGLRFVDVAAEAWVEDAASRSNGACAADYDNDGDTDLYVGNYGPSKLFRNRGDGVFDEVTAASGLTESRRNLRTMGCAWGDYDADGFLDLIFVRHLDDSDPRVFAWGQRDLSEFADPWRCSATAATAPSPTSPCCSVIRPPRAAACAGPASSPPSSTTTTTVTRTWPPATSTLTRTPTRCNSRTPCSATRATAPFTDLPPWASGANDTGFGRGAAYGDFDGDGCRDLYLVNIGELEGRPGIARLFRNNCATGNNWLIVRTVGTVGTRSNRDGIGATITVSASGRTQRRTVTAGSSQMSQNMLTPHFGLGTATHVDTLTIRWPSGRSSRLTDVAANQVLVVTEPDG